MGLAVVFHELPSNAVDLHGQLAGRGDDDGCRPIARHELGMEHELHTRNEER